MNCLDSLALERDHRAVMAFHKVSVTPYAKNTPLYEYQNHLIPYAFSYVVKQFSLADKVKVTESVDQLSLSTKFCQKERTITTSIHTCTCGFCKAMQLPCRHIFSLCRQLQLNLFEKQLCGVRWTRDYYKSSHRVFSYNHNLPSDVVVTRAGDKETSKVLSESEKYRKAFTLAQKLASVASHLSMRSFQYGIHCIEQIVNAWEQGNSVVIHTIDPAVCDVDEGSFKCDNMSTDITETNADSNVNDVIISGDPNANEVVINADPNTNDVIINGDPNTNDVIINADPNANDVIINTDPNANDVIINADPNANDDIVNLNLNASDVIINADPNANDVIINADPNANDVIIKADPNANDVVINADPNASDVIINADPNANDVVINGDPNANDIIINADPNANDIIINADPNANDVVINADLNANDVIINGDPNANDIIINADPNYNNIISVGPNANDDIINADLNSNDVIINVDLSTSDKVSTEIHVNDNNAVNTMDLSPDDNAIVNLNTNDKLTINTNDHVFTNANDGVIVKAKLNLSPLHLPPKIKVRGRPKGAGLTVIGLPRKKNIGNGPVKFMMKPLEEKELQILGWILPDNVVKQALHGKIVEVEEIPTNTSELSP